jgi:hypothetical protein
MHVRAVDARWIVEVEPAPMLNLYAERLHNSMECPDLFGLIRRPGSVLADEPAQITQFLGKPCLGDPHVMGAIFPLITIFAPLLGTLLIAFVLA